MCVRAHAARREGKPPDPWSLLRCLHCRLRYTRGIFPETSDSARFLRSHPRPASSRLSLPRPEADCPFSFQLLCFFPSCLALPLISTGETGHDNTTATTHTKKKAKQNCKKKKSHPALGEHGKEGVKCTFGSLDIYMRDPRPGREKDTTQTCLRLWFFYFNT